MDRFMALFRHHPDPIFLTDPSGKIIYWNRPAEDLLQIPFSPDHIEIVAREAVHRFQPSLDTLFGECLQKGEGSHRWVLPLPLDPCSLPIKITIMPLADASRNLGAWGVCNDVDRQDKEDEGTLLIKYINSFLLNMIEGTAAGIVVMDNRGKVLIFNRSMEAMTGFKAEQVVGVPGGADLFYGWDTARENMTLMRGSKIGPPGRLVMLRTHLKSGNGSTIPVSLSAAIITEQGVETGSVGVFSDLRESLRLERELRAAQQLLIDADKNAALGRLSASVAHEINNPLSGILMFAEMLQKRLDDDAKAQSDLQEIIDQTLRCKSIVKNLLGFSRKSSGERVSFDVRHAIGQCLDIILPQPKFRDIEVARDFQEDMPKMIADKVQIQQVITNLLLNAADAMEGKGRIALTVQYDTRTDLFTMQFWDTGHGIADELKEQIFESYYTTKPVGYGTGLGLSISQEIIRAHGGAIGVADHLEGGTVFTIQLPAKPPMDEDGWLS